MNPRLAEQKDRSDPSDDTHAAGGEEENDWDEYADEIASAVAFASWQQTPEPQFDWDKDDTEVAAERGEVRGFGEDWEDWAAVDELEDDVTYHWSKDKDEGH
ncbi:MAG: hypothetical protein F4X83_02855 [Chloroflexi bacterium]|nr:hypothetical protein [Chloroflexota bacterium]